jgi:hypothetical protein
MLRRLAILKLAVAAAAFFVAFVFFLGADLPLLGFLLFDEPLDADLELLEIALAGRFLGSTSSEVAAAALAAALAALVAAAARAFASARFACRLATSASGSVNVEACDAGCSAAGCFVGSSAAVPAACVRAGKDKG